MFALTWPRRRWWRSLAVCGAVALTASACETPTEANIEPAGSISPCRAEEVPDQVSEVIADIRAGGPFDYPDNDDRRFGNYEQLLPEEDRNFYREYTVTTPGLSHRGPRRIVTGGTGDTPDVWYYTADHYDSFCELNPDNY